MKFFEHCGKGGRKTLLRIVTVNEMQLDFVPEKWNNRYCVELEKAARQSSKKEKFYMQADHCNRMVANYLFY